MNRVPDLDDFLHEVGKRVKSVRAQIGLTRKELSKLSSVSERHLAQLETGGGNISLRLLRQIADATSTPIETFVKQDSNLDTFAYIRNRINEVDTDCQEEFLAHINQWFEQCKSRNKSGRVALIGLRGAGKSTIGKRAAEKAGLPFVELHKEIVRKSGIATEEIFSLYGEGGYRQLERQCLKGVCANSSQFLLAVSGGIVEDSETYNLLLQSFHTVWLTAQPQEHMGRVMAQGDRRPVQGNPDAMENLRRLLARREPMYQLADHRIDTSGHTVVECCEMLQGIINSIRVADEDN
jgi:XRE family aerobic/anaerobic benzoate catabolism transcriptional regulator